MMGIVVPGAVVVLVVTSWYRNRPGEMTADRERLYQSALSGSMKDADAMRKLADAFERERLRPQAKLLRQRAALRELSDEVKKLRRATFRKALKSTNKQAILELAEAYDREGCTGACDRLREVASGLP